VSIGLISTQNNSERRDVNKSPQSVLILAFSWPPDGYVGAVRPVYLARQLARLNWQPVIVTLQERYYEVQNPSGIAGTDSAVVIRTRYVPNARYVYLWLKRKFGWLRQRNSHSATTSVSADDRITNDVKNSSASTSGPIRRSIVSLLYTPDEHQGWFPFALVASLRAVARHRPRCVISTGPPFTSHLVALTLKAICGLQWVADFRDPWSWREHLHGKESSVLSNRINRSLERMVMKRADRVVCVSPAMTNRYRQLYPKLPAGKWRTITNGYDMAEFTALGHVDRPDRFTISYVGGLDFSRTPSLVLRAIGELVAEGALARHSIALRFVGPCQYVGEQPVEEMIAENGLNGIAEIVGLVPRRDALREILCADALVLLGGTQRLSVAAKVYEYLAGGAPILAIVEEGDTAEIIRRTGAGLVIAPSDLKSAKDAIRSFYEKYHQDKNSGAERRSHDLGLTDQYDWETLGKRYADVLDECCEDKEDF
jgi:glycosyltransferase involved in cell wall biosynthesis